MAFIDKFDLSLDKVFGKVESTDDRTKGLDYVKRIIPIITCKNIFSMASPARTLSNIFADKALKLDDVTISDLLSISKHGQSRMDSYLCQHVIFPPLQPVKKPTNSKLSTFTKRKTTHRAEQTKTGKVTFLFKRAYAQLQRAGIYIEKTVALPLAFCNELGQLRDRHKSKILQAFENILHFGSLFSNIPHFQLSGAEVIIDFLRFMHEPTPPDIEIYKDLAAYYWRNVIQKYGFDRDASIVTVVIDKAIFLPPVRNIIHTERKKKSNNTTGLTLNLNITDTGSVPHGVNYSQALQDPHYKHSLICYLQQSFLQMAVERLPNSKQLIVDCDDRVPKAVIDGSIVSLSSRSNNKGEADCGIYFHASKSYCKNILIVATDTDILLYGIAAMESNYLTFPSTNINKMVSIEKSFKKEYFNVNAITARLKDYELVVNSTVKDYIGHCIFAIYLLAGSDYISSIFGVGSGVLMNTFFKYCDFVSPIDDPLVQFDNGKFKMISHTAFSRLLCCVYVDRYKKLTSHIASTAVELFNTFKTAGYNMNGELQTVLEWLGYDSTDVRNNKIKISTLEEWCAFVRRVCFFMNHGSKSLYQQLLPSDSAIELHCMCGTYVMTVATQTLIAESDFYFQCEAYGWVKDDKGNLSIQWDQNIEEETKTLTSKRKLPKSKCSCKIGPSSCTSRCRTCSKACKPCTNLCNCKGNCFNPHNGGGKCELCEDPPLEDNESRNESDSEQQEIAADNVIADVSLYFNHDDNSFVQVPLPYDSEESSSEPEPEQL